MKLSPPQLLDYFVAELHFSLNSKFDPKENVEKKLADIEATPGCTPIADKPRCWSISLELKYQPAADTNTPYLFALTLVGMVEVDEEFPAKLTERLVQTNGPSILYSIARELVREQTARGPEGPFILPTASFVQDPPPAQATQPAIPAATGEPTPVSVAEPSPAAQPAVKPKARKRPVPKNTAKPSTR